MIGSYWAIVLLMRACRCDFKTLARSRMCLPVTSARPLAWCSPPVVCSGVIRPPWHLARASRTATMAGCPSLFRIKRFWPPPGVTPSLQFLVHVLDQPTIVSIQSESLMGPRPHIFVASGLVHHDHHRVMGNMRPCRLSFPYPLLILLGNILVITLYENGPVQTGPTPSASSGAP